MTDKLKKDLSKDGTYRDTPADKYVVEQLAGIFEDYYKGHGKPSPSKEDFEKTLFHDIDFHKWLLERHQLFFLWKPVTNSWELSSV